MSTDFHDKALRRLAQSWNRLDLSLVEPDLAEDAVYESQMVLQALNGKEAVCDYLSGKFNAIRSSIDKGTMTLRAEIAHHHSVQRPLIVLTQVDLETGENHQLGLLLTTTDDSIKRIDACIIPAPHSAYLTGEVPM